MSDDHLLIHASTVVVGAKAVAFVGASGSGKSAMALQMMALGATLLADDGTLLRRRPEGGLWARCPKPIQGKIEARGVGILMADHCPSAPLRLVVNLDEVEPHRLPPRRKICYLGEEVDLLLRVDHAHFVPAILQYLKAGRIE